MRRFAAWLALGLALGGAGSCGDAPWPVAGILTVSLSTPNAGADGAILLVVTGPSALTSVTAEPGLRVFAQTLGTANHFAVTGPLPNGPILTIGVPDVNRVSQYGAAILDVAASDHTLRLLYGYSVSVSK